MDERSAGSEVGGAREGGEVETDEIGDIGLGCCQLRMSGCEAEGENVCILSGFSFRARDHESTDQQAS